MRFYPQNMDYQLSPHTGLERRHWVTYGKFLIEQMFSSIKDMDSPLLFPKVPGKSYPQPNDPPARTRSAEFEGFTRSLNLTAPLMQEEPTLTIRGRNLLDYYHCQLRTLIRPDSPNYVPLLSSFPDAATKPQQMTCEWGGLAVILLLYPRLWEMLNSEDRQLLVTQLTDYAHGITNAHNWRYFNVMMLVFLHHYGFSYDEKLLNCHLEALLALDAGDGWFRDMHFDYYNAWVFQLYAPIFCRFYGYTHTPELADLMENQSHALMGHYLRIFARNGHMLMWGRSITYRTGAISPIPAAYLFRNPANLNPGWARRICSGNLLQFMNHPQFLENGVPALGFYGHFEPAIQSYSCAGSPMWGHLNFLSAFSLPAEHPFWTTPESDGDWMNLDSARPRETVITGPGLCLTNYPASGHTELRSAKVDADDPGYNRLAYHTAFPWEPLDPQEGMAMHYTRKTIHPSVPAEFQMPVKVYYAGYHEGVLYRQLKMNHNLVMGTPMAIDLADISLECGLLRFDRPRLYLPGTLRLCHYGLPHIGGVIPEIERRRVGGYEVIIARIPGRQLAMVSISGWDHLGSFTHAGFSPEADMSTVLFAEAKQDQNYGSLEPKITLLIHKCDDLPWNDDQLMPIASWQSIRFADTGVYGGRIELKSGALIKIRWNAIESDHGE